MGIMEPGKGLMNKLYYWFDLYGPTQTRPSGSKVNVLFGLLFGSVISAVAVVMDLKSDGTLSSATMLLVFGVIALAAGVDVFKSLIKSKFSAQLAKNIPEEKRIELERDEAEGFEDSGVVGVN